VRRNIHAGEGFFRREKGGTEKQHGEDEEPTREKRDEFQTEMSRGTSGKGALSGASPELNRLYPQRKRKTGQGRKMIKE